MDDIADRTTTWTTFVTAEGKAALSVERAIAGEPVLCNWCRKLLPEERDLKFYCDDPCWLQHPPVWKREKKG